MSWPERESVSGSALAAGGGLVAALPHADALVIDEHRRVVSVSQAADRLLGPDGVFERSFDRLHAVRAADEARLGQAIACAVTRGAARFELGPGAGVSGCAVALRGADGLRILLILRDAQDELEQTLTRLAARFVLTPAELRVLRALVAGCSVPQMAARLGVARTTARTHLQRVFAKTGARRQRDLLHLVASSGDALLAPA